jgi:aryl-alcohol dehydrogenase
MRPSRPQAGRQPVVQIRAAVTEAKNAPFVIQDVDLGALQAGEVLVKVHATGICHTDLIVRDQWYPVPLPAVLGHEGAGVIERVGPGVTKVAPGDRVAMSFNSCGGCPTCTTGRPAYCHDFFARNFGSSRPDGSTALSRDGAAVHSHFFGQSSFATYAVATERNVVKLPADVPLEIVAPFGCGIQTGAGAVLNTLRPQAGTSIAIFGAGTVGLAATLAAYIAGCTTVIAVDVIPERLHLARNLEATHVIDATATDVGEQIVELTGSGADFALECTGNPDVLRQAVDALTPTGTCGIIGAPAFGTEVSLDVNHLLTAGRVVRGIVEGDSVPDIFIPRLIDLWRQGRFPVEQLMETYDFDAIDEAVADAENGRTVKAVLSM